MTLAIGTQVFVRPSYGRPHRAHGPGIVRAIQGTESCPMYSVECKGCDLSCTEGELELGFSSWYEVLAFIATPDRHALYYRAPLDVNSTRVEVRKVYKNGKIVLDTGDVRFTADSGHLDRMRVRA